MTESEFHPFHNRFCKFTLISGEEIGGVIIHFDFDFGHSHQPAKYYLIRNYNMIEYKNAEQIGDIKRCKTLSELFDISNIVEAETLV